MGANILDYLGGRVQYDHRSPYAERQEGQSHREKTLGWKQKPGRRGHPAVGCQGGGGAHKGGRCPLEAAKARETD